MAFVAWQSQTTWYSYMEADFPQSERPKRTRQVFFDLASCPVPIDGSNKKLVQIQGKGHRPTPLSSTKEYVAIAFIF